MNHCATFSGYITDKWKNARDYDKLSMLKGIEKLEI